MGGVGSAVVRRGGGGGTMADQSRMVRSRNDSGSHAQRYDQEGDTPKCQQSWEQGHGDLSERPHKPGKPGVLPRVRSADYVGRSDLPAWPHQS